MISYEKLVQEYKKLSIEKYYHEVSSRNKSALLFNIHNIIKNNVPNKFQEINNMLDSSYYCNNISLTRLREEKNKYLTFIQIFNRILASDLFYDINNIYMSEFSKRRQHFVNCLFLLDNQIILYEGVENLMSELDNLVI